MSKKRIFIAVDLSDEVRRRASDLVERFRSADVRVTWVAPENMHITLKFLGDQSDDQVATVCRAVLDAVRSHVPFEFVCQGAGAFPNVGRPRTLWVGVREGVEPLKQLFQAVDHNLAGCGYPQERRVYHPHLTIGRVRAGGAAAEQLTPLLAKAADFQAGRVQATEVLVFGSHLQRHGPRYEVLARAPLEG
jgi:2'-5' RNA ligase